MSVEGRSKNPLRLEHICPWWLAYTFDNPLRRLIHRPEKIVGPYLKDGMTAIDIGCGLGFFSIAMAKLVGDTGRVISADLQQKMLKVLRKRAQKAGMLHRIRTHLCRHGAIGVTEKCDFALTFYMVHEVPNTRTFIREISQIVKPAGKYLLVEPWIHTGPSYFEMIMAFAREAGFTLAARPPVLFSRTALFENASFQ